MTDDDWAEPADLLRKRIFDLTNLPDNWDSYGGKPTSAMSGQRMFGLLRAVTGYPGIVSATTDGGITAEWRDGPTTVIIEFDQDGKLSIYWSDEDQRAEQELK